MRHRGVRVVAALGTAALVVGLAGAGASAKTAAQGGSAKKTILVGALGPFFDANTGTKSSEWPAAVKARVKAFNKANELPGYKLAVFECDTGLDPNQTEQCARDAAAKGVIASVGFNGTTGTNLLPLLQSEGIPAVGTVPVSPAEVSNPDSFPFTSGIPGAFEALPVAIGNAGATKQSLVLTDLGAATAAGILFVDDSVKRQGYDLLNTVKVAPDQTDFAPIVASSTQGDPQGMSVFIIGEAAATYIKQLRQSGYKGKLSSGSPFLTQSLLDALGSDANGILVPSLLSWQKSKGGKQYIKEMKQYAKGQAITDLAANYWLSTWVVGDQVKAIVKAGGTPDAASLLAAMGKLSGYSTQGMTPPITTTQGVTVDSPIPLPRLFNDTVVMFQIKKGKVVQTSKQFLNPYEKQ
jgi:branched-chain amino acid transport system substrate-binding protein